MSQEKEVQRRDAWGKACGIVFHISWHVFLLGFFSIAHAPLEESGKQHFKIFKAQFERESIITCLRLLLESMPTLIIISAEGP